MEAKSLMIGDFVLFQGREICVGNQLFDAQYKDCIITPIPLTEDILKANGFEEGCYHTLCINGYTIEICLEGNIPMYFRREKGWQYTCPHPKYVHELQHALRIVGLDDLADNFKVK